MPSPSSAPFLLRDRTPADDSRPAWSALWQALAAETAASNEPDPSIEAALDTETQRLAAVEPDAGGVLISLDPEDDSMP